MIFVYTKEGWLEGSRESREGGGTVKNTWNGRGGMEKRGGETKIFKRGAQAGLKGRCFKKGGGGTPLTNYVSLSLF